MLLCILALVLPYPEHFSMFSRSALGKVAEILSRHTHTPHSASARSSCSVKMLRGSAGGKGEDVACPPTNRWRRREALHVHSSEQRLFFFFDKRAKAFLIVAEKAEPVVFFPLLPVRPPNKNHRKTGEIDHFPGNRDRDALVLLMFSSSLLVWPRTGTNTALKIAQRHALECLFWRTPSVLPEPKYPRVT